MHITCTQQLTPVHSCTWQLTPEHSCTQQLTHVHSSWHMYSPVHSSWHLSTWLLVSMLHQVLIFRTMVVTIWVTPHPEPLQSNSCPIPYFSNVGHKGAVFKAWVNQFCNCSNPTAINQSINPICAYVTNVHVTASISPISATYLANLNCFSVILTNKNQASH
jgi:hypothetical protein